MTGWYGVAGGAFEECMELNDKELEKLCFFFETSGPEFGKWIVKTGMEAIRAKMLFTTKMEKMEVKK